jgi:hypothetical protein
MGSMTTPRIERSVEQVEGLLCRVVLPDEKTKAGSKK